MMKKALICALALVLLLTACGSGRTAADAPFTLDDAETLLNAGVFNGDMGKVDSTFVIANLYHVDENAIEECVSYQAANTSQSADEVVVIVFTSKDAAVNAEVGFQQRIDEQIANAKNYAPEAVPRLEAAVIRRVDNTILLAVGDPDRLAEAVDNLH